MRTIEFSQSLGNIVDIEVKLRRGGDRAEMKIEACICKTASSCPKSRKKMPLRSSRLDSRLVNLCQTSREIVET